MSFMDEADNFFAVHSNPLTVNWILSSGWVPIIVLTIYPVLCFIVLPYFVRDREPMQMTNFLVVYNAAILIGNFCLFAYFTYYAVTGKFSPICQPVSGEDEMFDLRVAQGFYAYLVSKLIELADSIIIILRQKTSQANCLHFYHHSSMFLIIWIGLRFLPGGSSVILAAINTFFHVIMYLYFHILTYGLGGMDMTSFKTIATISQIIQFCMGILHCITAAIANCGYPRPVLYVLSVYIFSFIVIHYAKGRMPSLHLRNMGIFSDGSPPPDRPRATISSASHLGDSKSSRKNLSDAESVFLPQPAGMPSNTRKKVSKQIFKNKGGSPTTNSSVNSLNSHLANYSDATTDISLDPEDKLNNKEKDMEVVSSIMIQFGNYLSRSPKIVPEDSFDRLVNNGVKYFGNKPICSE